MFEVNVNGRKQRYRSKPTMNVDTTGSSGDVSIPKPLTYDYMPEGYPSKSIGTVTLMEEQEVSPFTDDGGGLMVANSPVTLEIKPGDKLTVVWDGASYDVEVKRVTGPRTFLAFGNLGLAGFGETTDYPFLYADLEGGTGHWATADTTTNHTIKVTYNKENITPMSTDFLPKNFNVVFIAKTGNVPTSCNVTYDELRGWLESNIPVLAMCNVVEDGNFLIIKSIGIRPNALAVQINESGFAGYMFNYNSDGTFSVAEPS